LPEWPAFSILSQFFDGASPFTPAFAGVVDGVRDALTRVTTPLSGAYYYVPSLEQLATYAPIAGPED
jgi:hypothetical protein